MEQHMNSDHLFSVVPNDYMDVYFSFDICDLSSLVSVNFCYPNGGLNIVFNSLEAKSASCMESRLGMSPKLYE